MSYCLNPSCQKPENSDGAKFCVSCGTKLLLKERFRTIQPIGEGGFGRTFLAEDADRLNARCVIKQFLPVPQIQSNSAAMARATGLFEQEARQLLHLGEQHPQIPTLFAYFEQDKRLYLVQQYIQGQDLWKELEGRETALPCPYGDQEIRELLNDLLPVLQFVHEHQVIHRDIKPMNIIRRQRDRKLVLIDFGISKQLTVGTGLTQTGTKAGTEGYAPIEQLRTGKAYPASDLYSLGVTCIQLLTSADVEDLYDPMEGSWVWKEQLRQDGRSISDQLSQVLDKLLQDSVKERYQSAEEVLQDLNAVSSPLSSKLPVKTAEASAPSVSKSPNWRCLHTLTGHSNLVRSVAISPDGKTLASGSFDHTIKLWQLDTGNLIHSFGHSDYVRSVTFSPDNQTLASGSDDKTIKLWNLDTGKLIYTLAGHSNCVLSVDFSPDGKTLASGSFDKTIKLWQLNTGKLIRTLTGHLKGVSSVAYSPSGIASGNSPDGQTLVSGSGDSSLKLWDLGTGKPIPIFMRHSNCVNSVAFSPDGKTCASGSDDKTINLWQLSTMKLLRTLTGHSSPVSSIAYNPSGINSPDRVTLASGSRDSTIKLWHLGTGKMLCTLTGHSDWVYSVAFSLDGQTLVSGSGDKTIKIWRCD